MRTLAVVTVLAFTSLGTAAVAQSSTRAEASPNAVLACTQELDSRLKAWRVTPERYELIASGYCNSQKAQYLQALRDQLSRVGGTTSATDRNIIDASSALDTLTDVAISAYAFWYESSERESGQSR